MAFHKAKALQEAEKSVVKARLLKPSGNIKTSLIMTPPTCLCSTPLAISTSATGISPRD